MKMIHVKRVTAIRSQMFVKRRSYVVGIRRPVSKIGRNTVVDFVDNIWFHTLLLNAKNGIY